MKLTGRLLSIAEKLPKCDILADVGTDHGYIPIYAVKNNICRKAIAVDLKEGPLKAAFKNVKKNLVEDKVEIRLGSGLESIQPGECDLIVIAGMGGTLIRDILSASIEKAKSAKLLVLQPNTALFHLRKWLYENGFDIVDESLSFDSGKFYCIISAKSTGVTTRMEDEDYYLGVKLFSSNDPLLEKYLAKKLNELNVIIEGRAKSNKKRSNMREYDNDIGTEILIRIKDRITDFLEGRRK